MLRKLNNLGKEKDWTQKRFRKRRNIGKYQILEILRHPNLASEDPSQLFKPNRSPDYVRSRTHQIIMYPNDL